MNTLSLAGPMPMLLAGLKNALRTKYPQLTIFICPDLKYLEAHLQQYNSDVLLLDLSLEKLAFRGRIKRLFLKYPKMKVVVLSPEERIKIIRDWFKIGILAYANPTLTAEEFMEAMEKVDRGQPYLQSKMNNNIINEVFCKKPKPRRVKILTPREIEVLSLIVGELTTKEIAARLFISPCTAETHRLNIIHKLGVKNTAGIVREAVLNELYL